MDFLVRASENSADGAWSLLYSTGTSLTTYPFAFGKKPYLDGDAGTTSANLLMIADLNDDGRADIWHSYDDGPLSARYSSHTAYLSNGMAVNGQASAFYTQTFNQTLPINKATDTKTIYGDFNGDGKPDMMSLNGLNTSFIYPKPFQENKLLVSSYDGFGNKTTYNYKNILFDNNFYYRTPGYDYDDPTEQPGQQTNGNPYMVIKSPFYALSKITIPNGIGGTAYVSYAYEDAAFSPIRGFLGFKKIIETNNSTGYITTKFSDIHPSLLIPFATLQQTYVSSTKVAETNISSSLARINAGSATDKRYTYRINQVTGFNGLTLEATQSTNTFDSYNNITKNVTGKGNLNGSVFSAIETTTTTTVFGAHNTPVPAVPESITTSAVRNSQPAAAKTVTYTYDAQGNVATFTHFAGTPVALTQTNTYDDFGNVIQAVTSVPNTTTPVVTFTYDNSGRFLTKKESTGSSIPKKEQYSYDPSFGLPATYTSSDGLTTSYDYDNFGRLSKTTLPDGNAIVQSYSWETLVGRYSVESKRFVDNGLYRKVYYDVLGREIKNETGGFNGANTVSTTAYNYKGQLESQTDPYYASEPIITTTSLYDGYGRLTSTDNGTSSLSYVYALPSNQYKISITNAAGQVSSTTKDASGRVVSSIDNGGQLIYTYDSWGNQTSVKLGSITVMSGVYDSYGKQSSLTDKNAGTILYYYDALGRISRQTDALNNTTYLTRDAFGRVISRAGPEGTTSYVYYKDAATGECNDNLSTVTGFEGDVTTYTYDNLSRLTVESVVFNGITFNKTMGYDTYSNLIKTTYPSGLIINDTYDKNAILTKTTMGSGAGTTLFTATAMNSKGVYTGYTYGNGKTSTVAYDLAKGAPTRYYTPGLQDLNFNFDGETGNLLSRNDALNSLTETFTYDNLNRLTGSKVNNVTQFTMAYDAPGGVTLGNIKTKSDLGNYTYKTDKINAVAYITSIAGGTTPPPIISQNEQNITYTPFLKAATISESNYSLAYTYGEDQQRIKSVLKQGTTTVETKYYLGAFERLVKGGVTKDIHYINAGNGLCAIIVKQGATITPYYIYTDHLGSLLTATEAAGAIVSAGNFDAWGRIRNPATWTPYTTTPTFPDWLYRGYTGHEHLAQFALINMNGRIYDPGIGRMLSPDNYVQNAYSTQDFNRYSYCNNNPLIYTDPSGNTMVVPSIPPGNTLPSVFVTSTKSNSGGNFSWFFNSLDWFGGTSTNWGFTNGTGGFSGGSGSSSYGPHSGGPSGANTSIPGNQGSQASFGGSSSSQLPSQQLLTNAYIYERNAVDTMPLNNFSLTNLNRTVNHYSVPALAGMDFYIKKDLLPNAPKWLVGNYGRAITMEGAKDFTSVISIQMRRIGWQHGGRILQTGTAAFALGSLTYDNILYYRQILQNQQNFQQVQDHYNDITINPAFWLYKKVEPWLISLGNE